MLRPPKSLRALPGYTPGFVSAPPRSWPRLAPFSLAPRRLALLVSLVAALAGIAACASPKGKYRYTPQLTARGADLQGAFAIASGFPALEGNEVELLVNGGQAFPSMLEAIRGAKHSIHMENNIFRQGAIGTLFVEAMAERARAGVQVRLLVDSTGASLGSVNEQLLADAGATFVPFRKLSNGDLKKINLRTHRKILLVDGTAGFIGGICIDDPWDGDADQPTRWRDTSVRIKGPIVTQIEVAFARAWMEATDEVLTSRHLFAAGAAGAAGTTACQLMDSIPGRATNPARLSFLIAASAAQASIDLTAAYFVPDAEVRKALIEAHNRGVRVRLLLSGGRTDLSAVRYAGRRYYQELLEAGIEIYEYLPAQLHAKTFVVDGAWATVGSANLDRRSMSYNYECNMIIYDQSFAQSMVALFERDLELSSRVTLDEWKARSSNERLHEWFYGWFRMAY